MRYQERTGEIDATLLLRLQLSGIHEQKRHIYVNRAYALRCDGGDGGADDDDPVCSLKTFAYTLPYEVCASAQEAQSEATRTVACERRFGHAATTCYDCAACGGGGDGDRTRTVLQLSRVEYEEQRRDNSDLIVPQFYTKGGELDDADSIATVVVFTNNTVLHQYLSPNPIVDMHDGHADNDTRHFDTVNHHTFDLDRVAEHHAFDERGDPLMAYAARREAAVRQTDVFSERELRDRHHLDFAIELRRSQLCHQRFADLCSVYATAAAAEATGGGGGGKRPQVVHRDSIDYILQSSCSLRDYLAAFFADTTAAAASHQHTPPQPPSPFNSVSSDWLLGDFFMCCQKLRSLRTHEYWDDVDGGVDRAPAAPTPAHQLWRMVRNGQRGRCQSELSADGGADPASQLRNLAEQLREEPPGATTVAEGDSGDGAATELRAYVSKAPFHRMHYSVERGNVEPVPRTCLPATADGVAAAAADPAPPPAGAAANGAAGKQRDRFAHHIAQKRWEKRGACERHSDKTEAAAGSDTLPGGPRACDAVDPMFVVNPYHDVNIVRTPWSVHIHDETDPPPLEGHCIYYTLLLRVNYAHALLGAAKKRGGGGARGKRRGGSADGPRLEAALHRLGGTGSRGAARVRAFYDANVRLLRAISTHCESLGDVDVVRTRVIVPVDVNNDNCAVAHDEQLADVARTGATVGASNYRRELGKSYTFANAPGSHGDGVNRAPFCIKLAEVPLLHFYYPFAPLRSFGIADYELCDVTVEYFHKASPARSLARELFARRAPFGDTLACAITHGIVKGGAAQRARDDFLAARRFLRTERSTVVTNGGGARWRVTDEEDDGGDGGTGGDGVFDTSPLLRELDFSHTFDQHLDYALVGAAAVPAAGHSHRGSAKKRARVVATPLGGSTGRCIDTRGLVRKLCAVRASDVNLGVFRRAVEPIQAAALGRASSGGSSTTEELTRTATNAQLHVLAKTHVIDEAVGAHRARAPYTARDLSLFVCMLGLLGGASGVARLLDEDFDAARAWVRTALLHVGHRGGRTCATTLAPAGASVPAAATAATAAAAAAAAASTEHCGNFDLVEAWALAHGRYGDTAGASGDTLLRYVYGAEAGDVGGADGALGSVRRFCEGTTACNASVFVTTALRVYVAELVGRVCGAVEGTRVHRWCTLLAHTHLDLAQYMLDHGVYDDERLEYVCDTLDGVERLQRTLPAYVLRETFDRTTVSALDMYRPHATRCLHDGDLPNYTQCYEYLNFFSSSKLFGALTWPHMNMKRVRRCCQIRQAHQMNEANCVESDSYYKWMCLCIEVSLKGVYEHAKERPRFAAALVVHRTMRACRTNDVHKDALLHFMTDNERVVNECVSEHIEYQTRANPALYHVLGRSYAMSHYGLCTRMSMDMLRRVLSRTHRIVACDRAAEHALRKMSFACRDANAEAYDLMRLHRQRLNAGASTRAPAAAAAAVAAAVATVTQSVVPPASTVAAPAPLPRPKVYRHKKYDFVRFVCNAFDAYDILRFARAEWTDVRRYTLARTKRMLMDRLVASLQPGELVDDYAQLRDMLVACGVSACGADVFDAFVACYEHGNASEASALALAGTLSRTAGWCDYATAAYLFERLRAHNSVRLVEINNVRVVRAQIARLCERYGVVRHTELPGYAGRVALAPCCNSVKTLLSDGKDALVMGNRHLIYDAAEDRYVCLAPSKKPTAPSASALAAAAADAAAAIAAVDAGRDRHTASAGGGGRGNSTDSPQPKVTGGGGNKDSRLFHELDSKTRRTYAQLRDERKRVECNKTDVVFIPLVGRILELDGYKHAEKSGGATATAAACGTRHVEDGSTGGGGSGGGGSANACTMPIWITPCCGLFDHYDSNRWGANGYECTVCAQACDGKYARIICDLCHAAVRSARDVREVQLYDDEVQLHLRPYQLCAACYHPSLLRFTNGNIAASTARAQLLLDHDVG